MGMKISEATLRTTLKGTENIPITDTDLPNGRTTAANLKTFVTPDLSGYATIDDIPSVDGFITKTDADGYYQAKGNYLTTETASTAYATKTELANKQDTLVSGTNIKTINGETILGSGDIEVEDKPTAIVDHGTGDTTFELTTNVLHKWGEVASLTLTLGAETPGVVNEYMFQFTSGATATQLQLPDTVKWA